MARTPMVAANWKMNMTVEAGRSIVSVMSARLRSLQGVECVLCPPFTSIQSVSALLAGSSIAVGAQNMHWEAKGAYTGEISPAMVHEFCKYVILGHSERRAYFGESDEILNRKLSAAAAATLTPIFCVGETLEQYESGRTAEVVGAQIKRGLKDLQDDFVSSVVIAYEPVWAIGTGRASTPANAQEVTRDVVRAALASIIGKPAAERVRVLYGGSVTAANAAEYFAQPDIDGALLGGASLKPDDFVAICAAAAKR